MFDGFFLVRNPSSFDAFGNADKDPGVHQSKRDRLERNESASRSFAGDQRGR